MDNNRCVCCGEIIPEGRQVCFSCENQTKIYHCVVCGQQIAKPKLSFGGRKHGKTMTEFWHNISQLCCSEECLNKLKEEIRGE